MRPGTCCWTQRRASRDVQPHRPLVGFVIHLEERQVAVGAGVIDQNVDPRHRGQCGIDESFDRGHRLGRQVFGHELGHHSPRVADGQSFLGAPIAGQAVQDDVASRGGKGLGNRAADSLSRTGDQGRMSLEVDHGEGAARREKLLGVRNNWARHRGQRSRTPAYNPCSPMPNPSCWLRCASNRLLFHHRSCAAIRVEDGRPSSPLGTAFVCGT